MGTIRKIEDWVTIVLFLVALALPLPLSLRGDLQYVSQDEKRPLAPPPDPSLRGDLIDSFPRQFDAWYADHFGLRRSLLAAYHETRFDLFRASPTERVVVGKEGWLFSRASLDEMQPLDEDALGLWATELTARAAALGERGTRYLFVAVPDKADVFEEHLPAPHAARKATASRIDAFCEEMATRTEAEILGLRPILREAKQGERSYSVYGTHWNSVGAHVGYEEIVERLRSSFPEVRPIPWEDFGIPSSTHASDLGRMMGLKGRLLDTEPNLRLGEFDGCATRFELPSPGDREFFGTECPDRPLRVLIFRDSFSTKLAPFLSETFGRVVYIWSRPTRESLMEWVDREQPDVVIEERVARLLSAPWDDG